MHATHRDINAWLELFIVLKLLLDLNPHNIFHVWHQKLRGKSDAIMICTRNGNWMLSQALSVELEGSKTVPKTLICCTLPCCKLQHWCFWRCWCNAHLSSYFSESTAYEERRDSPLTFKANSNITNNPLKRPFPTPNMQIQNLLSLRYNARNKGGTSLIYMCVCVCVCDFSAGIDNWITCKEDF